MKRPLELSSQKHFLWRAVLMKFLYGFVSHKSNRYYEEYPT
jgi:hypothetical protein